MCMAYIAGSSEDPEQTGHSSYSSLSSLMCTQTSRIAWQNDRVSNNVAAEDASADLPPEDTTVQAARSDLSEHDRSPLFWFLALAARLNLRVLVAAVQ